MITIDWTSLTIGIIIGLLVWFCVHYYNKIRNMKAYTLHQLRAVVKNTNDALKVANNNMIFLNKAFKDIENEH